MAEERRYGSRQVAAPKPTPRTTALNPKPPVKLLPRTRIDENPLNPGAFPKQKTIGPGPRMTDELTASQYSKMNTGPTIAAKKPLPPGLTGNFNPGASSNQVSTPESTQKRSATTGKLNVADWAKQTGINANNLAVRPQYANVPEAQRTRNMMYDSRMFEYKNGQKVKKSPASEAAKKVLSGPSESSLGPRGPL